MTNMLKSVQPVFNWSEFHLSEITCCKIHTLESEQFETTLISRDFAKSGCKYFAKGGTPWARATKIAMKPQDQMGESCRKV